MQFNWILHAMVLNVRQGHPEIINITEVNKQLSMIECASTKDIQNQLKHCFL